MKFAQLAFALFSALVNVALCRLRHSHVGSTAVTPHRELQQHQSHKEPNQNQIKNCTPPNEFFAAIDAKNMSLLATSVRHAAYSMSDDGPDMSIAVFDCVSMKQLLFLHIPKNAGSTITGLGFELGIEWGWRKWTGQTQVMSDGNQCAKWHVPPNLLGGDNPYASPTVEVFCVTRDPWERMLSEYMYLLFENERYGPYPNIHDGQPCTVEGFNQFVQHSISDMKLGHPYISDCHLVPQWNYIESSDGREWCKHKLPISQLTEEFNKLMSSHGLDARMEPHHKDNSRSSYCPDLHSQGDQDLSSVFYPETKAAMRSFYATDFAHLGDSLNSL